MKPTLILTLAALCAPASADLIEVTTGGYVHAGNPDLFPPGGFEGQRWDATFVIDTDKIWLPVSESRTPVVSATVRVGDHVYDAADGRQSKALNYWFENYLDDDTSNRDWFAVWIDLGEGMTFSLSAFADSAWWAREGSVHELTEWNSHANADGFPRDFDLSDFLSVSAGLSSQPAQQVSSFFPIVNINDLSLGNSFSTNPNLTPPLASGWYTHAVPEWALSIDSLTSRVVPTPASITLVGVAALAGARRRRS